MAVEYLTARRSSLRALLSSADSSAMCPGAASFANETREKRVCRGKETQLKATGYEKKVETMQIPCRFSRIVKFGTLTLALSSW